jgi:hypothetical protein
MVAFGPTAMVRDGVVRIVLRVLFAVYAAATALHIALVMAHEPFAFDAWNIASDTRGQPFSFGRFLDYVAFEYAHSNPRIGQWMTYLAYKLEYFAPIATPIAYLGLAGAVTVLGLGRWPGGRHESGERDIHERSESRGKGPAGAEGARALLIDRDLALCAIAIGFAWFALPRIGMIMFCRAYGANYLYGATIQLWFLVPLRLRPDGNGSLRAAVAYGVAGVIAGMANEHTGPTLVLFMAGYAAWGWRRSGEHPQLAWAGALGAAVGFAMIFFAPGQASRYEGLATKVSLVGRVLQRGITSNLDIFGDWMLACAPVLGLLVIIVALARRDVREPRAQSALGLVGGVLIAGTVITATVFASPKLGARFYLHGCALVLAGFVAVADALLSSRRRLAPFVVLAIAASIYAGVRTLPLYDRLSEASDERLAEFAATPRGGVYTATAFEQVDDSWWFLGDDFRDAKKRELVASYFGLRGVIFRAVDIDAPLGVSDVRLVPRYRVTPRSCLDEHGGFDLGTLRGIDIRAVHQAVRAAVERARDQLAYVGRLEQLDVAVEFTGAPPPLPRPTLLVARWLPGGFEAHAGAIERRGSSKTRVIALPPELRGGDFEIYAYQVGGEARRLGSARDATLAYVPWKRGAYWALACGPAECFVIAVARVL